MKATHPPRSLSGVLAGLVLLLSATAVAAETTIDVAVNVVSLSEKVDAFTVACMVCVGDCPANSMYTPYTGATRQVLDASHSFSGSVRVAVPNTTSGDHDHYMCRLELEADGGFPVVAGTGAPWTQPLPDTAFTPIIAGPLPLCDVGKVSDANGACIKPARSPKQCRAGQKLLNGACMCLDGQAPVQGKCPPAASANNGPPSNPDAGLGIIIDLFRGLPCPNNGIKLANGTCAAQPAPPADSAGNGLNLNLKLNALPRCPDGSIMPKTGVCPPANGQR